MPTDRTRPDGSASAAPRVSPGSDPGGVAERISTLVLALEGVAGLLKDLHEELVAASAATTATTPAAPAVPATPAARTTLVVPAAPAVAATPAGPAPHTVPGPAVVAPPTPSPDPVPLVLADDAAPVPGPDPAAQGLPLAPSGIAAHVYDPTTGRRGTA